jgi:hypothetical protein
VTWGMLAAFGRPGQEVEAHTNPASEPAAAQHAVRRGSELFPPAWRSLRLEFAFAVAHDYPPVSKPSIKGTRFGRNIRKCSNLKSLNCLGFWFWRVSAVVSANLCNEFKREDALPEFGSAAFQGKARWSRFGM